jgi:hypothetical protein
MKKKKKKSENHQSSVPGRYLRSKYYECAWTRQSRRLFPMSVSSSESVPGPENIEYIEHWTMELKQYHHGLATSYVSPHSYSLEEKENFNFSTHSLLSTQINTFVFFLIVTYGTGTCLSHIVLSI